MTSENDHEEHRHMNDTTMPPPLPRPKTCTSSSEANKMNPPAPVRARSLAASSSDPSSSSLPKGPRNQKGLRKGFGLHDWALLTKSAKDLAQRKGAPLRAITKEELKQHCHVYDGWCSLKGKVYNIAPYLPYHPGGESIMHKVLGWDATALFEKYHRWVNIDGLVGTLQIGYLDVGLSSKDDDNKPPIYLASQPKPNEFAVPAPVITKSRAKDMSNVLPPKQDQTDDIEEDYTEPWEQDTNL